MLLFLTMTVGLVMVSGLNLYYRTIKTNQTAQGLSQADAR